MIPPAFLFCVYDFIICHLGPCNLSDIFLTKPTRLTVITDHYVNIAILFSPLHTSQRPTVNRLIVRFFVKYTKPTDKKPKTTRIAPINARRFLDFD